MEGCRSTGIRVPRFLLLVALLVAPVGVHAWGLKSGNHIPGHPVGFDYRTKKVQFSEGDGEGRLSFPAETLSLRSKQRFLIHPVFFAGYPEDPAFPREKLHLFLLAFLAPMAVLVLGFWIAGMFLAGKVNPLRALTGCVGAWFIGTIFVLFYLFFATRLGGGYKTVLFGSGLGIMLLSVYVSAVYQCSIFKGFLIFLAQIFVAFFLAVVGLALSETLIDTETVESFWTRHVFEPVGMVEPAGS